MEARYAALRVGDALRRNRCDYARACKELVILLREVYSVAHKSLQAALFQDVISAFRILQEARGCSTVDFSAAHLLAQACDAVLPRQKKSVAAAEHKTAAILWQRNSKHAPEHNDSIPLPADVLVHVFSFLDGVSLATAACVCRSWRAGAKEDQLWHKNFSKIVGDTPVDPKILLHAGFKLTGENQLQPCKLSRISIAVEGCWKKAFELTIIRSPKLLYLFSRAQCLSCKETFWPSELSVQSDVCRKRDLEHKLRPLLPEQVVCYVLIGSRHVYAQAMNPRRTKSTGDSDSDEDHYLPYAKLWDYAKCLR